MTDKCREEFEKWANNVEWYLDKYGPSYDAWQAAWEFFYDRTFVTNCPRCAVSIVSFRELDEHNDICGGGE
jgi:hypothetical protein